MTFVLYKFPTLDDGIAAIEHEYCRLLNIKRSGQELDEVVIDWMDTVANTVLDEQRTQFA